MVTKQLYWDKKRLEYKTRIRTKESLTFNVEDLIRREKEFKDNYRKDRTYFIVDSNIVCRGKEILHYEREIPSVWYKQSNVYDNTKR